MILNLSIHFFKKFKIGGELDFDIKNTSVADYLNITLDNVRRRLQNKYSITKKFIENVDFMKIKSGKTSGVSYMINYQCFEKIAMSSETQQSDTIKLYLIIENQKIMFQSIN